MVSFFLARTNCEEEERRREEEEEEEEKEEEGGAKKGKELCMKVWNLYRNAMILYGNYLGMDYYGFLWIFGFLI